MSKKKSTKKHKFKHVESDPVLGHEVSGRENSAPTNMVSPKLAFQATLGRDFSYVQKDIRRIAVMAVALVTIELVIYGLLTHTPAGETLYRMVNV